MAGATYHETLKPMSSGTAERPIVFKAMPGQQPVLDGSTLAGTPDGIRLDGGEVSGISNITFSGFALRYFDESIHMVLGAHDCQFYDLDVGYGKGGFYFYGAYGAFIAQCAFHHNTDFGVVFNNYSSDIYIRDCEAHDNTSATGAGFDADSSVENITLYRCKAYQNSADGFNLRVKGLTLNECAAYGNVNGIHLWDDARVQNTLVYDNQLSGIVCDKLTGATPAPKDRQLHGDRQPVRCEYRGGIRSERHHHQHHLGG